MEPKLLLPYGGWVRSATLAHMILSHMLSDEELDALLAGDPPPQPRAAALPQAA